MTDSAAVEYWLAQWADWMRQHSERLGYPQRALVCSSGGASEEFDALVERADMQAVIATDAAIRSLEAIEQAAVNHRWLAAVYRLGEPVEVVYARAVIRLEGKMRGRVVF